MKVEIISAQTPDQMQKEINGWLSVHSAVTIKFICQGSGLTEKTHIVISIFYEE